MVLLVQPNSLAGLLKVIYMRLAHISDVHIISLLSAFTDVRNFKQFIGLFNWVMYRRKTNNINKVYRAVEILSEKNIDALVVTGDISQLALLHDYREYARIMRPITEKNIPIITIKGNHDHYCRSDKISQAFQKYIAPLELDSRVENGVYRIKDVELFHIEGAVPTPLFRCWGELSLKGLKDLESKLKKHAKSTAQKIAFGHFPLLSATHKTLPAYMELRNADKALKLFERYNIMNYLCGHIHKPFMTKFPNNIKQFCSGSISASGLIHLFDIADNEIFELDTLSPVL